MNNTKIEFQPVFIIGAPRSGTNILRDVLCQFKGVSTWPCDEINYIWRHGNIRYPYDNFPEKFATYKVTEFIRNQFLILANKSSAKYVVEKTCANSLRVPFVESIFPEAKYIYIVRNGVDVVASAAKRWKADLDIPYIIKKSKYIPKRDIPFYVLQYSLNRLFKIISKDNRLKVWGPRINDDKILLDKSRSIEEICALQWNECVRSSDKAFSSISKDRIHYLKYEDFVINPEIEIKKISIFLGWNVPDNFLNESVLTVNNSSVGKGKKNMDNRLLKRYYPLMGESMKFHDYGI
ncbi:sulfotransferase [Candidatus Thioglobus sp.]|nr:sulfotransferase [Candidatus Thioglobus sp.]